MFFSKNELGSFQFPNFMKFKKLYVMRNITCPNFNAAFKIDVSGYESITKQVRDNEVQQ